MRRQSRRICRYIDASPLTMDLLREFEHAGSTMPEVHVGDPDPETLERLVADAEILLNGHTVMDAGLLAAARELRTIIFLGTGASSYIDLAAARERGIAVRTIAGYGDRAVAEHAFGLLLAAARNVAAMDRGIRAGVWDPAEGIELRGRTLGVIGLGGIGREMARIATGFGMRVLGWNRTGSPASSMPEHCERVELDALLGASDAVTLHLALTSETTGFLDRRRFAMMRPGAILINTARAGLVDTAALVESLRSGGLGHAALDVFDVEPPALGDPLTALSNVTLTAHAAYKTRDASRALIERALALLDAEG